MEQKVQLHRQLSQLFDRWCKSEAQIRLYGPSMPQSKQIMEAFFQALTNVFETLPAFSIVKNTHGFEILAHSAPGQGDESFPLETSSYTVQATQTFERFDLHSITFKKGLGSDELERFFGGLHMSPGEAQDQNGLAGYLKEQKIAHVELDRFRLRPQDKKGGAKATDEISQVAENALMDLMRQTSQGLQGKDGPVRKKAFASTWERYLSDRMDAGEFIAQHQNMVTLAQDKPEIFVRALQNMAAKQGEIEAFLANLEAKLFDVGFPLEAIERITQQLGRPKKVWIDEAELARLRQIERNYQPDIVERIGQSLAEIQNLQQRLSDERERGDAIVRQSSQGVMVIDKEGRIQECNPVAEKVLGLSAQEARGKVLKEVIQNHHMLSVVSGWENETETHTPKQVTIEAGSEETIDTIRESAIVIEDKNGRSIGGVAALQEVVRQQDIEKRKNDILDVLGHDLRAPLNIVKQNIALIADFVDQPDALPVDKQQEFLGACKRHIERMEKLINKILDARQLETGKMVLKKDTCDTNKLIEDAAHSLDTWAQEKNINISIQSLPLPELYCDPERIYQVITNFISNGLKFTPEGGSIRVSAKTIETENGPMVEIVVTDSGMGIKAEDLERIFNKYEQVSLQHPTGVSGLGLGLSVCKAIIEMHDGTVWADSRIGEGSTFTCRIPLVKKDDGTLTDLDC